MTGTAGFSWSLPPDLETRVRERLADLLRQDVVRRIWAGDPYVWTGGDEDRWLGWLRLPVQQRAEIDRLREFAGALKREAFTDLVLLGMGGSSLAPEVLYSILGPRKGFARLHLLDSTDPEQILAVERRIDLATTLFLVASKSGSTLEVNILKQHFYRAALDRFGVDGAGAHFVLTTDPGSRLEQTAAQERFRAVFAGVPSVGGRYSALSNFGMVPASLIGIDLSRLLARAELMAQSAERTDEGNAALQLGVMVGTLAQAGRDKLTLMLPRALAPFGAWLEQLVAESLGKAGKGVIPIDGEAPGPPEVYGGDRVFVHVKLNGLPDHEVDDRADALARAGQPVLRLEWEDEYSLGAEFFRWEFATAVMGAVLGVNPFDQPDVEAAKVAARRLAAEYEHSGALPQDAPLVETGGLSLFADAQMRQSLGRVDSVAAGLRALLGQLGAGDYFALAAFIPMTSVNEAALQAMRTLVRNRCRVATTAGFGPRFLHSTGQAHKGGPDSGVFLQITTDHPEDLPVPGQRYSFGTIELAQARGDFEVLAARGRRLLRVHLRQTGAGLQALHDAVVSALA